MAFRSPFPGMDPWIELFWEDIHARAIPAIADQIETQLPPGLVARLVEHVFVEDASERVRKIAPDVRIVHHPSASSAGAAAAPSAVAVEEPLVITVDDDPIIEHSIQIIDARAGGKLITAIELLSKTNKRSIGLEKYRRKQTDILAAGASLVEIDLLREGGRISLCPVDGIPPSHRTAYQICVHRPWRPLEFQIWAVSLRRRIPAVRIPLRQSDADANLDLQPIIDTAYQRGRYDDLIDYATDPIPSLNDEDAAWANQLLKAAGKR